MGKLVSDVTAAYNAWAVSKDISTLNESELGQYNLTKLKFEKAIQDASAVESAFYEARSEAFAALEAEHQGERAALQTLWQGYEDNNMEV